MLYAVPTELRQVFTIQAIDMTSLAGLSAKYIFVKTNSPKTRRK